MGVPQTNEEFKSTVDYFNRLAEVSFQLSGHVLPQDRKERDLMIEKEKAELISRDDEYELNPKLTIRQLQDVLGNIKTRFQKKDPTLTTEEITNKLSDIPNYLYEINWRTNPNGIFYRLDGLMRHDIQKPLGTLPMFLNFFIEDGYPEKIEALDQFGDISFPIEQIERAEQFLGVTERALKDGDTEVSVDEMMGTFIFTKDSLTSGKEFIVGGKKVIFEGDWDKFDSFEEFLSIRTLLLNALAQDPTEITISKGVNPENKTLYIVTDNGKHNKYFGQLQEKIKFLHAVGSQKRYKDMPGLNDEGGAGIVAFLTGQRGDEISAVYNEESKTKSLHVTFTKQEL